MSILQVISTALTKLRGPWILGGDWNVPPETLVNSGWVESIGGIIVAPKGHTCNSSTYDYFVVAKCFSHAIRGIQIIDDSTFQPHRPVRLLVDGNARRKMVQRIKKPSKILGVLPHGPSCKPMDYPTFALVKEDVHFAIGEWYDSARHELRSLSAFQGDRQN